MFWRLLAKAVMFMYKRLCEVEFCIFVFYYFSAISIKSSEKGKFSFRFNDLQFLKTKWTVSKHISASKAILTGR